MPRLRHKPNAEYSHEASQVLNYIINVTGESLDWSAAEYNRIKAYGLHDPERSVLIYDAVTGETMGVLTARAEAEAEKAALSKTTKAESGKPEKESNGKFDRLDYFLSEYYDASWMIHAYQPDFGDGDAIAGTDEYWIVTRETTKSFRRKITFDTWEKILNLPKMPEKTAIKYLTDLLGPEFPAKQVLAYDRRKEDESEFYGHNVSCTTTTETLKERVKMESVNAPIVKI